MNSFMIHFLRCNLILTGLLAGFLLIKWILKDKVSSRLQYCLWFPFLAASFFCFLPLRTFTAVQPSHWFPLVRLFLSRLSSAYTSSSVSNYNTTSMDQAIVSTDALSTSALNDYTESISQSVPSVVGTILFILWCSGMILILIKMIISQLRLIRLKRSSLPIQNQQTLAIFSSCQKELGIHGNILFRSTAFIQSPITVGLLHPQIYVPLSMIRKLNEQELRYILLHELTHVKYHDSLINLLLNLVCIIYWFHPLYWISVKQIRADREIACDASVLSLLGQQEYYHYGRTLISFAENVSPLAEYSSASGLSGSHTQIYQRICKIAAYRQITRKKTVTGICCYLAILLFVLQILPLLTFAGTASDYYHFNCISDEQIHSLDLSTYFGDQTGCFVLYDRESQNWSIYDQQQACKRLTPASTYKIYDGLLALESGLITTSDSQIDWNGYPYAFESWNQDQDLSSALSNSVNWYFQSLDQDLGFSRIRSYLKQISYGNELTSGSLNSYWGDGSLKISAIEQVELLQKLYDNEFNYDQAHIDYIKDSMLLSQTDTYALYGKTGTVRISDQDVCGWFIGFLEIQGRTYFFATNIQNSADATGAYARAMTEQILTQIQLQ